ncbi:MAG: hypothetical protein IJC35_03475 [Oscillospiraceae bacterium]|nr:hypothetical protein [Oscillospiraceae bacterium]
MWMVFGIAAILTAVLNVLWTLRGRDAKWFRFISISLTALTLCAFSGLVDRWILQEDWSALMDTAGHSRLLWPVTAASVIINGISLFSTSGSRQK